MNSYMWREAAPDTDDFKEMVRWIWEDYGYYKFGADILDPQGKKVGVFYSAIRETSVKFVNGNQIMVMPNTPFLWGPGDGSDRIRRANTRRFINGSKGKSRCGNLRIQDGY